MAIEEDQLVRLQGIPKTSGNGEVVEILHSVNRKMSLLHRAFAKESIKDVAFRASQQ